MITVRTGLLWWTVAIHLLLSMAMVWLSVLLLEKVREPDDLQAVPVVPAALRWLTVLSAVVMTGVLIAGTMVTGAGPHAGDKSIDKPVPRLKIEVTTLVHLHADLLIAYLSLLLAIGFALFAVGAPSRLKRRLYVVVAVVAAQAVIGITQYLTDIPAALVVMHVAGAGACVAATAALWVGMRPRSTGNPLTASPAEPRTAAAV